MINWDSAFSMVLFVVPGFVSTGTMGFVMGFRKRDWSFTLVWSLFFSVLIYSLLLLILRILLSLKISLPHFGVMFLDGLQRTNTDSKLMLWSFDQTVVVSLVTSFMGLLLGILSGRIAKTKIFGKATYLITGHTYHQDLWGDFIESIEKKTGKVFVLLKDGNAFLGSLIYASEVGMERGLILRDVLYLREPLKS